MESLILIPLLLLAILPVLYGLAQYNVLAGLRRQARRAWNEVDAGLDRRHAAIAAAAERLPPDSPAAQTLALRLKECRARASAQPEAAAARSRDEAALVASVRAALFPSAEPPDDAAESLEDLRRADDRLREAVQTYEQGVAAYHRRIGRFPGSFLARIFGLSPFSAFAGPSVFDPANGLSSPAQDH